MTEGHPDKMADQISDAILDALLTEDPNSRVACETLVTTGLAVVAGEIRTEAYVEIPNIVRRTICAAGYDNAVFGFDGNTCAVMIAIDDQSPDLVQGVGEGAGDQGMMFGYACDETDVLMPLPIHLAHRLAERHAEVRRAGTIPYLRPDAKTQVTFDYEGSRPMRLRTVLVSTQHRDGIDRDRMIRPDVTEQIIEPVIPERFADDDYEVIINPSGRFVIGGPQGDAGLTGRKIIVDTYGGMARHGGGAFSGKDPSKVDRSRGLRRPLGGQAHRRGRGGVALRDTGGLRHRHSRARLASGGDVRHRDGRPGSHSSCRGRGVRPASGGDHARPRPAPAHLHAHGCLRPLRTAKCRRALHLGELRQAGRSEVGSRPLSPGAQGRFSFEEPPPEEPAAEQGTASAREGAGRSGALADSAVPALVVRVLPDVVRLDKMFDYAVPDAWNADGRAERLAVGSIVRVRLGGRRLRAWVTEVGVDPPAGVKLQLLAQLTGMGPPADVMSLAGWAAWRWAGSRVSLLRAASPAPRGGRPGSGSHRPGCGSRFAPAL